MLLDVNTPIFIIGYMGAGKSTLGRKLAHLLGRQFVDTDFFIENRFRCSIADMFVKEGEEKFRRREKFVLEELLSLPNAVIATGGGVPCFYDNMTLMNEAGMTIYLRHTVEHLTERLELCKRSRPSVRHLSGEQLLAHVATAMQSRSSFYEQAKMIVCCEEVNNDRDETKLAERIAQQLLQS